jgi:hypothetical protein
MGLSTAIGIANTELSIEDQIAWHFRVNCYPPVPVEMVPTAVEAVSAYWEDDLDRMIPLPEGVSFRGKDSVSASNVISSYRLDAWVMEDFYDED